MLDKITGVTCVLAGVACIHISLENAVQADCATATVGCCVSQHHFEDVPGPAHTGRCNKIQVISIYNCKVDPANKCGAGPSGSGTTTWVSCVCAAGDPSDNCYRESDPTEMATHSYAYVCPLKSTGHPQDLGCACYADYGEPNGTKMVTRCTGTADMCASSGPGGP